MLNTAFVKGFALEESVRSGALVARAAYGSGAPRSMSSACRLCRTPCQCVRLRPFVSVSVEIRSLPNLQPFRTVPRLSRSER